MVRDDERYEQDAERGEDSRRKLAVLALIRLAIVVLCAGVGALAGFAVWGVIGNLYVETHHFSGMWYVLLMPPALVLGAVVGARIALAYAVRGVDARMDALGDKPGE